MNERLTAHRSADWTVGLLLTSCIAFAYHVLALETYFELRTYRITLSNLPKSSRATHIAAILGGKWCGRLPDSSLLWTSKVSISVVK